MDKQVSRVPAEVMSGMLEGERAYVCVWDASEYNEEFISEEEYNLYMNYFNIGDTFIETETRYVHSSSIDGYWTALITKAGEQYFISDKQIIENEDFTEIVFYIDEYVESEDALEFESLFAVLRTLAHQVGVEKADFVDKYDIVKSIFDKFTDGRQVNETTLYEVTLNLLGLVMDDLVYPSVKTNDLRYDGQIWKFDRVPDPLEYLAGDVYVNNTKVGTYNGFTCRNTLSGWEEAALAIESVSFGNQAVSLMKEENGEWQLK